MALQDILNQLIQKLFSETENMTAFHKYLKSFPLCVEQHFSYPVSFMFSVETATVCVKYSCLGDDNMILLLLLMLSD